MYGQKKNFSTFSYKLVQISPIMILVNSGAFLSISSWFCELTELIFVMIPYISSTGCPPTRKGLWDMWKWRIVIEFLFLICVQKASSMKILLFCLINSSRHRKCFLRGFIHELFVSKALTRSYLARSGF